MARSWILFLFLIFSVGCQKYGLLVRQQKIDPTYLASTHIGSPDPRQACPPRGQFIIVEWWVPYSILEKQPKVVLQIIFHDYSQARIEYPIDKRIGYEVYEVLGEKFIKSGGALTYKAEIITCDGEVFRNWKHQMWVNLIQVEQEESDSANE